MTGGAVRRRVVVAYAVLLALVAGAAGVVLLAGDDREPPPAVAGAYAVQGVDACVPGAFTLQQSGRFVNLDGERGTGGSLEVDGDGRLTGTVACADGGERALRAERVAAGDRVELRGTLEGQPFAASRTGEAEEGAAAGPAKPKRSGEEIFGRLMLAIAVVILVARLLGAAVQRIGQPAVIGEVLGGILLGPTLLGAVAPEAKDWLFPSDIIPLLSAGADIGLAFYMFMVGLELDPRLLRGRVAQAAVVSNASVALPMTLGLLVALPLYGQVAPPDSDFVPFALFMGVAMSITAFPVLARILVERRLLGRTTGALALASAAIDDVTAWGLLAFASAVAASGSGLGVLQVVGLTVVFCVLMGTVGRRLLARVSRAYDEGGATIPPSWIVAIFTGVLLSAWATQSIGVAAIFGAFVMGLIMPRRAELTHDVTRRMEDFVIVVLLPLFFVVTGLKTEIGLLDRPELWLMTGVLLAVAVAGKWLGAYTAARYVGIPGREANALGALMNTRGLTELIVLGIGLELGLISPALFAMLVLMALITTAMTGPALRLIDPRGVLSAPPEQEVRDADRSRPPGPDAAPERAILVAVREERNLDPLLTLAEPMARSTPPREVILAALVRPRPVATGTASDDRRVAEVHGLLADRRTRLDAAGVAVRAAAFTSADPGPDLVRLASEEEVDLILVDGRRPLVGDGVPRGSVGHVLQHAPCDVAVLVEREGAEPPGPDRPVVVPFGGGDSDWAALELAAWIASLRAAPLRLLGARKADDGRDPTRLLASASLVVQQLAGVMAEPVLLEPGRDALVAAGREAGLLVVGLSDRWRSEGLGDVRQALAREAPAPILFVRRGTRVGALAPPGDHTRFTWSAGT